MKSSLRKLFCLIAAIALGAGVYAAQVGGGVRGSRSEDPAQLAAAPAAAPAPAAAQPAAPPKTEAAKPVAAAPAAPVAVAPAPAAVAPAAVVPAAAQPSIPPPAVAPAPVAQPAPKAAVQGAKAGAGKGKKAGAAAKTTAGKGKKATAGKGKKAAAGQGKKAAAGQAEKTAAKPAVPKKVVDPKAQTAIAWEPYPKPGTWMQRHAGFVAQAQKGGVDVLLLGDSITDGWNKQPELWTKYFAPLKAANFGIGGDRTENIVYRIVNGELAGIQPKVVMILIGTNNTSKGDSAEDIARGVVQIVRIIQTRQPQAKILLLGVYPRGEKPADEQTAKYRDNIKQVNELIRKLDDGRTIRYIYFGDKYLAPDGTIPKSLMPDFLHLTSEGYQVWADSVIPVIQEMMQ